MNAYMKRKPFQHQRAKVVSHAEGRILEIGIGSGLNLEFYDPVKVKKIWGLDPSAKLCASANKKAQHMPFEVEFIESGAENIPLEDASVDTVLTTYTLCTIPDVITALKHMRRVLKPSGRLIFCEHGKSPDEAVQRWQNRLNPMWKKIAGGCDLTRQIPELIEQSGFTIERMNTMCLPGPDILMFTYWGNAVRGNSF